MKTAITFAVSALFLLSLAACEDPAAPTAPEAPAAAADLADLPPAVAVPEADLLKAAEVYKVLHDSSLDTAQKQERANAMLSANGWTEETYSDLLFDISAHPASRERYLQAIERP
jgi:hypothetical protein